MVLFVFVIVFVFVFVFVYICILSVFVNWYFYFYVSVLLPWGCHSLPNWVNWVNSNFNYRRHYLCCQCILRPSLGAAIAGGGVGAGVSAKLSYVFIGVNALAFPYQIAHEYFHGKYVWQLWILELGDWNKCRPQTNLSGSLRWP